MICTRGPIAFVALTLVLAIAGCGETTSTGKFSGERHDVAQTISKFQSAVSTRDQKKLCESLAAALEQRLQAGGGCQAVFKKQLVEVDSPSLTIESITIKGTNASARVKTVYSGKNRVTTMNLVKEDGGWKISGLAE